MPHKSEPQYWPPLSSNKPDSVFSLWSLYTGTFKEPGWKAGGWMPLELVSSCRGLGEASQHLRVKGEVAEQRSCGVLTLSVLE